MIQHPNQPAVPRAQAVAERLFSAIERFLRIEAISGLVLLLSAAAALVWANSFAAHSYHVFWEQPLSLRFGSFAISPSLHFIVNDVLMSVFFLVVGMEIRREIHDGALADVRVAALPIAAAAGGVAVPAIVYTILNDSAALQSGWAVPTATDIAFAVGVLALLGKFIPLSIRILLLALAIIDDIAAVIIIAAFYGGGIDVAGFPLGLAAILIVIGMQAIGIGNAFAYVIPGALLWAAFHHAGLHPSLAGVVLGLITPVRARAMREPAFAVAQRALQDVHDRIEARYLSPHEISQPLKSLQAAQRELLAPVVRVQMSLHPWVAFGVMPLFALANAGVTLGSIDISSHTTLNLGLSVGLALIIGKPIGIFLGSWLAVRLGWCKLPRGVTWTGVLLVGVLGGIGFTMSIFIATLAFPEPPDLAAAKLGVLVGSAISGVLGLVFGYLYFRAFANPSADPTTANHAPPNGHSPQ